MKKRLLCSVLGISLCLLSGCGNENTQVTDNTQKNEENVSVEKEEDNQSDITFSYDELENGTLSIWSYTGGENNTMITIPSEISGKKVSEVTGPLLKTNDKVKKVVLPETVTEIGKETFYFALNMEELIVNGAVESVGKQGIYGCSKLKTLTFKDGLKYLEEDAIGQCENLTDVYLPGMLESIDSSNFGLCADPIKIHVPAGSDTETLMEKVVQEHISSNIEIVSE